MYAVLVVIENDAGEQIRQFQHGLYQEEARDFIYAVGEAFDEGLLYFASDQEILDLYEGIDYTVRGIGADG